MLVALMAAFGVRLGPCVLQAPLGDHGSDPFSTSSRDLTRRAAVTTGADELIGWEKRVYIKEDHVSQILVETLTNATVFSTLDPVTLADLVQQMYPKDVEAETDLIREGDEGDCLYIVESGEFKAYLRTSGDAEVASYHSGALFGELALLYSTPRAATITCTQAGRVWTLDRRAFRGTLAQYNVAGNEEFLKAVDILAPLTDRQRAALARCMTTETYDDGDYIVRKGEVADALYFIKSGEVIVHMRGKDDTYHRASGELIRFREGQFFGENAIHNRPSKRKEVAEDAKRSANVVAVGRVVVLKLTASDFHALLGDLSDVIERNFCAKVIDSVPLFKPLSIQQRDDFVSKLTEVRFQKNDVIIKRGDQGSNFYIIKAGQVQVLDEGALPDGRDKELNVLGPADFFGERSLLKHEAAIATVRAVTNEVVLYSCSAAVFEDSLGSLETIIRTMEEEVRRRDDINTQNDLTLDRMEHMRTLGVGTFGRVKLVRDRKTNVAYALKILDKRQVVHMRQEKHLMQEKTLLAMCSHPFIIRLAATFQDNDKLYMVMEICLGGELFSRLQHTGPMPDADVKFYTACVVSAFSYLHRRRIAYRDLKPENLLLDATGYIKVVDFGFAKQIFDRALTLCGTPEYLAPEIILNKSHDIGVDWWTTGILMYELLAGHPPFTDPDPMVLYQKIIRGKVRYPARFEAEARDLMSKLIEINPAVRIGASTNGQEVMDHPWFATVDFRTLERKEYKAPYIPTIKSPFDDSNFEMYDEEDDKGMYRHVKVPLTAFDGF